MALTETVADDARVVDAVLAAHERLGALAAGLTEEAVRAPSALPGWSRAHLFSHIEGVCRALARQAEYALRGELVEVYDGGRPTRDAAIEAGAARGADELREAVAGALAAAGAVWRSVGPDDWARPVRYRDGELRAALRAWWREAEIHGADALLGPGPDDWSRAFCDHALDFLAPRAPEGARLVLVATDGPERRAFGTGEPVTVRGRLTDLTAWLAGRTAPGPLDADPAPLPELGPWP
ncbi:maleylpyruvate isomerase family mycothiol-dependent enzyme [Streptomyces litchfieldiae]|uniref:Maleylpyruvate isomerase family mycothiol-dependent enzyme n=1 Tax=Streptomyces litchfieldiae TaxID=3075543 RepID=A0ABU2MHP3_9ACTN|nr:maleylpyruvate isomerase family mycothiol-dependent enzyme [Streptomyces sp. DSM 44938]MDT0341104.1 maleylpyruvate isomerase family mycothiol-dependent enzyme [Streptomyces sp. DSM 44938]